MQTLNLIENIAVLGTVSSAATAAVVMSGKKIRITNCESPECPHCRKSENVERIRRNNMEKLVSLPFNDVMKFRCESCWYSFYTVKPLVHIKTALRSALTAISAGIVSIAHFFNA
jgi:transposase-like protein